MPRAAPDRNATLPSSLFISFLRRSMQRASAKGRRRLPRYLLPLCCRRDNERKNRGGPLGMRQGRLVATGVMLAFCLFAAWQSYLLPLTDRLGPGPGFFPFWIALIGLVLAVGLLITTFAEPRQAADGDVAVLPQGPGSARWFAIVLLLAAAAAAMDFAGFRITMFLFIAALVIALGERKWWAIASFAAIGSFGIYYVFTTWLDVLLPVGTFGI
jgi:putative tricarboxylic transport membrane protein